MPENPAPAARARAWNDLVACHAYISLYEECVEIDPSTSVWYVVPLFELDQRSIDPTTPYGEIFPRNVMARKLADALDRMRDDCRALDSRAREMLLRRHRPEQPLNNDLNRRRVEIIRGMLSAWATKQTVDWKRMSDKELDDFNVWWQKLMSGGPLFLTRLRQWIPGLNALSDAEIDLAFTIAHDIEDSDMEDGEYFFETQRWLRQRR